jgi:aspartyl-tRNA(Asn)/glutamyl-tRNA(Gln) amidotransferase subunit A
MLRTWQISCVELVEEAIRGAASSASNAFITITCEHARREAEFLDKELRKGRDRGPLHGIPIAYKDLVYTRDIRTTNGSKIFAGFVPHHHATIATKLEAAGAISVGKLNMHELAYGITSTNPHFGSVRNPHNAEHIPGGSSGGSGAAVAEGIVFCGIGSDTGGSIRIPASFCGVVGLKATFGRVSRYGCFPLGLTLDHIGPLTRSVEDAALILNVIAGQDPHDEGTEDRVVEDMQPAAEASVEGLRIGLPQSFYTEGLHPDVSAAYSHVVRLAAEAGAQIVPVRVPDPAGLNTIARTILLCEASSVMAPHMQRREEIGADVLALLDQGRMLAATDYINAQRVRREMLRDWLRMFQGIDFLFTPTTPIPAPRIGQPTVTTGNGAEDTRLASTKFVRGINALGLPAISIPCGRSADGLPIGLQIVGRPWREKALLDCACAMERHAGY